MAVTAPYTRTEELAHSLTHGLGVIACAALIPVLVVLAVPDPWRIVTGVVFGVSALAMFVTSVVYHAVSNPRLKLRLRKLDHSAIYLLIAGTYTPLALVGMEGAWGWTLFGVIWGLAVVGIAAKLWLGFRYPKLSVAMYLAMGWLAIIATKPMIDALSLAQLMWILAGGLCYTIGVPFYVWKTKRFTHAVWHMFVLAGVACHSVAVLSVVRAG